MTAGDIEAVLADSPELEDGLESIREVDRENETWTFDDVPVDSGVFGELVGAGIVESVGDEYRLAEPDAVDQVLDGDASEPRDADGLELDFDLSMADLDTTTIAALVGILFVAAAVRATNISLVLRERVVYGGNDPYAYVYWVEQGLQNDWSLTSLPAGLGTQEPLTIVQLLYAAEIAGGLGSHRTILAIVPVILAVGTVLVVYLLAHDVTGDRRMALASAFVLAVLPVHVLRTALGFVDHHAFDFFWLVVTAWGLVRTIDIDALEIDAEFLVSIGLLGVGVAGIVLAWWAGTLLLVPIALAVTISGALSVRDDRTFLPSGLATTAGVGLGATFVGLTHVTWGWHDQLIVGVPFALTLGILGVVAATSLWRRFSLPAWSFPVTGLGLLVLARGLVTRVAPAEWDRITGQLSGLFAQREITEVQSIFDAETMGWLFSFGLVLFVILPAMVWGLTRVYRGDRRWVVAASYAWYMLFLAAVQSRFAGEFAPFAALFGGIAVVVVAEKVDAARPGVPFGGDDRPLSMPDRGVAFRVFGVLVLICGLSAVLAPVAAMNVAIPDEQYETAMFIDEHADTYGHEYPESYVFSPWSWNRMYNYHVNGQSGSYGYAQSNYREFTAYNNPTEAYQRIQGGRADGAYLVTEPVPGDVDVPATAMQSRLHDRLGSRGEGVSGLGHYLALRVSDSGDYKAFRVVSGATLQGSADANGTVRLSTDVDVEGRSFTYERAVGVENGTFAVTVSYPGEYELDGATADSVTVTESAVINGSTVRAGDNTSNG